MKLGRMIFLMKYSDQGEDTYVFKVGGVIKVGDIDAGPSRGVRPLHLDQLRQLQPPQLLLSRRTEIRINYIHCC